MALAPVHLNLTAPSLVLKDIPTQPKMCLIGDIVEWMRDDQGARMGSFCGGITNGVIIIISMLAIILTAGLIAIPFVAEWRKQGENLLIKQTRDELQADLTNDKYPAAFLEISHMADAAAQALIDALRNRVTDLNRQLVAAPKGDKATEALQKQLDNANRKLAEAEQSAAANQATIANLEKQIKEIPAQQILIETKGQLDLMTQKLSDTEKEFEAYKASEFGRMQSVVKDNTGKDTIAQLTAQVEDLKKQLLVAKTPTESKSPRAASPVNGGPNTTAQLGQLNQALNKANQDLSQAKTDLRTQQVAFNKLQTNSSNEINGLKQQIEQLNAKIQELKEDKEILASDNEDDVEEENEADNEGDVEEEAVSPQAKSPVVSGSHSPRSTTSSPKLAPPPVVSMSSSSISDSSSSSALSTAARSGSSSGLMDLLNLASPNKLNPLLTPSGKKK